MTPVPTDSSVRVVALGGTGEIGRNMYVVEHAGRMVVIDCGVTFPNPDQLGVDLVLPDFGYVEDNIDRLEAVILTHGHEDHIGALPYLVRTVGPLRVVGPRFTIGLVRSKLDEHRLLDKVELEEVGPGEGPTIGPFRTEFVRLTHSIPDCLAVALHTSAGTVVHTGDFKFDHVPVAGTPTSDVAALAKLGADGVMLLLADSTCAEDPAAPQSEAGVGRELRRLMATAPGRVIITTFSSHIHRVQQAVQAAYDDGRVSCLLGRSLNRNVGIATNLGIMDVPPGSIVKKPRDLENYPLDEQVIICTGSQGEYMAALSRMARGEHHQVTIHPTDTVVFSSRTVPGNELAVNDTINRLVRIGASFVTPSSHPGIHVSGHGTSADLMWMLQLLRPEYMAPIHGEARHQRAHKQLAVRSGVAPDNVFCIDNGDVLEVGDRGGRVVEHIPVGLTYVDGLGIGDVADEVMRDRRHMADDGVVIIVATVDVENGGLIGDPEIICRGFSSADDEELMAETRLAVERSLAGSGPQHVDDLTVVQHQLHDAVATMLKKRTGHRPMVLPVVVEA